MYVTYDQKLLCNYSADTLQAVTKATMQSQRSDSVLEEESEFTQIPSNSRAPASEYL